MSDRPPQLRDLAPPEREALIERLRAAAAELPEVEAAFVFGSFARGEPFRDLDVAVHLGGRFSVAVIGRIGHALWVAAGRPAYEIDIVPLDDAAPAFRLEVADQGILLAERTPGAAAELAVRAQSELIELREARRILAIEEAAR